MKKTYASFVSQAAKGYYEGEDPNPAPAPAPTATQTGTPNPAPIPDPKMLSQEHVNRLLAVEKEKAKTQTQKYISELETLRQNQNLSETEKTTLSSRIEELTAQIQTKEQQQHTEIQKLQKKYDTDVAAKDKEAQTWKNQFENKLKTVDIQAAASKYDSWNTSQITAILLPNTKVVEELEDGKPTGNHITKVTFMGRDKDQKPVKLELSVEDAVKQMTEMEDYSNLFKNKATGGVGASPNGNVNGSSARIPDIEGMSPQEYAKNRGKIRQEMANAK